MTEGFMHTGSCIYGPFGRWLWACHADLYVCTQSCWLQSHKTVRSASAEQTSIDSSHITPSVISPADLVVQHALSVCMPCPCRFDVHWCCMWAGARSLKLDNLINKSEAFQNNGCCQKVLQAFMTPPSQLFLRHVHRCHKHSEASRSVTNTFN